MAESPDAMGAGDFTEFGTPTSRPFRVDRQRSEAIGIRVATFISLSKRLPRRLVHF